MIKKKIDRDVLINAAFILFIFVICLWNLSDFDRVKVIDDEFGYWGIAARLAGYDWHDLLQETEYYSFGYSFILVPLFGLNRLGISMSVIYKLAIIMNAFFMAGTYLLIQYVIKKIFTDFPDKLIQPVSLFVVLYIGYSTKTDAAWTETYLLFMFWCVIALFIRFISKPGYMRIFWLSLATVNLFAIHMRSAGVVIAVIMCVCFYYLVELKKIDKKYILFSVVLAVMFASAFLLFKNYVNTNIYQDAGGSTNDISTNAGRAAALMSLRGIIDLFLSICGKLYNVGSASFLLVMFGLAFSVSYLIRKIYADVRSRKFIWQSEELAILFLMLAFLGELAVSSIFKGLKYYSKGTVNVVATDSIVYGRYFEFAIGPMIILGIWVLLHAEKYVREMITAVLAYFLCTAIVQHQYDILTFYHGADSHGFRGTASPWIALLYQGNIDSFAYYVAVISLVIFLVICFLGLLFKKEQRGIRLAFIVISICWGAYGIHYSQEFADSKSGKEKTVVTVEQIIEAADDNAEVYLVVREEPEAFVDIKILQWLLGNRPVHMCLYNELDSLNLENALFLTDSSATRLNGMMSDHFRYLYDSGTISVFVGEENKCYDDICKKAKEMAKISSPQINRINLGEITTDLSYIKENGSMYYNYAASDGGYMTGGMGLALKDGIYEFMIDIRAKECVAGSEIGYVTVGDTMGNIQNTVVLYADDFIENERQTVTVQVETADGKEPFIGLYMYGNAAVRVYGISYRKMCGNITLSSGEIEDVIDFIEDNEGEQSQGNIYYIDSDDSAVTGFPVYDKLLLCYLPGQVIDYKENFDGKYYIVEKTDDAVPGILKEELRKVYENNAYVVFEGRAE